MCHYNYWGYDGCSHELRHMDNRWTVCPLSEQMAPRDCPFAAYTRHKIGIPFCESCLDEVPPNHVPVSRIILDFDNMRQAMELSVDRAACARYVRDYRAGLRRIREQAFISGPNNNFYNDIWALYHNFHQRAISEMSASWATFDNPPTGIQSASTGLGITCSPGPSSTSPEYYSIPPGFGSTTTAPGYTMGSIDSTIMTGLGITSAGIESASPSSDSASTGSESTLYGFGTTTSGSDITSSGSNTTSPGSDSAPSAV